jgi:predicted outer membrane lipoprotein
MLEAVAAGVIGALWLDKTIDYVQARRRRKRAAANVGPAPNEVPIRNLFSPAAPAHRVIAALRKVNRPVTNAELAKLLGVSPSRATRLRAEVADRLRVERRGRCVYISIAN